MREQNSRYHRVSIFLNHLLLNLPELVFIIFSVFQVEDVLTNAMSRDLNAPQLQLSRASSMFNVCKGSKFFGEIYDQKIRVVRR